MSIDQAGKRRKSFLPRATVWGLLLLASVPAVVLGLLSAFSRRPTNLGVTNERLAECPDSPNCVSTFATDVAHRIEPLRFTGSQEEVVERLRRIIDATPRARIVSTTDGYLHAEFTSSVFLFVDDVEFLVDRETKLIHFRSASRVGRSDLGVNRKRMEALRQAFAKDQE